MLQDKFLDELRLIAYSDLAKASDRVSACNELYRNATDHSRIIDTLEEIAVQTGTPDSSRIKAISLLYRIRADIGSTEQQKVADVETVKETLMELYCGTTTRCTREVSES